MDGGACLGGVIKLERHGRIQGRPPRDSRAPVARPAGRRLAQAAGRCSQAIATCVARRASCASATRADGNARRLPKPPGSRRASGPLQLSRSAALASPPGGGGAVALAAGPGRSAQPAASEAASTEAHRTVVKLRTALIILTAATIRACASGAHCATWSQTRRHPGEMPRPSRSHEGIHRASACRNCPIASRRSAGCWPPTRWPAARQQFRELSMEYARLQPLAQRFGATTAWNAIWPPPATCRPIPTHGMRALGEEEAGQVQRKLEPRRANCAGSCCPRMRATTRTSSSRCAPAPGAMRRRSSPVSCSACTPATRKAGDSRWRCLRRAPASTAATRRSSARIVGKGAFSLLKFESGTHRVQRVPATRHRGAFTPRRARWRFCRSSMRSSRSRSTRPELRHRHLPLLGRGRPARQQDRLRGAHHAPAERHRGGMPG